MFDLLFEVTLFMVKFFGGTNSILQAK